MQCDVLDQEVQWIARGCVSDEALEQFGNPTSTGCTDADDLPRDFREGVINAASGFYSSVNAIPCLIYLYNKCLSNAFDFVSRVCKATSAAVTVMNCAMIASKSTRQLPFE